MSSPGRLHVLAGGGAVGLREIGEDLLQRRDVGQAGIGERQLAR